ncbi:MAG: KEOPS complex N(6)-L-threonylcarbamoyladenine synthase Kae1 [Candidatus Pacearchaeota archaeon]|nr:KEOPS complex N(6)-L-threonylcarbamoyladenine synthase Kae1 [Candidatus Pacearchaeota archaeon]
MITLGIECTAHTFGIAILKDKKFLCNLRDMYKTEKGGIIPIEAAKHHEQIKHPLLKQSLDTANITFNDIDLIAVSNAPGLSPCLLQGLRFAKELSKEHNLPIVPVNHCLAHLEIGEITGAKDPVLLYCSGANTQVIAYAAGKYRIFGETLDLGIGNFIDTFARYAGIGFPGAPKIEELAMKSKNKASLIQLPYSVKGMDVAFAGLLTNLRQKLESKKYPLEDLSFSLQETAFAMLIEVAERAMAHLGKKELLLGGGVACNKRLCEMAKIMCKERGAKCFVPEREFLVDNAAMIAFLGQKMFKSGIKIMPKTKEFNKLDIKPYQRTDDVDVKWKK